jgi:hypothetical protein
MALRLRRGTDAERLLITPVEGELIYTTDTKLLYAGDGSTAGGTLVTGSGGGGGSTTLDALTDTDLTGASDNDVLTYNSGTSKWEPTDTFNGTVVGTLNGTVTGNVVGTLDGELTGSVFGDDSNLIVDGIDGSIRTGNISSPRVRLDNADQPGDGLNGGIGEVNLDIASNDNRSLLNLRRVSETDLTGDISAIYGTVTFGREDVNGTLTTNIFFGRENGMYFGNTPTGVFNDGSYFMVWRDNKLGVGTATPAEALDVNGNGVFTGNVEAASFVGSVATDDSSIIINGIDGSINAQSFVQFGSLTTAERDALTAANGMVIYNTTNNKFEGYQNGGWINLDDGLAAS